MKRHATRIAWLGGLATLLFAAAAGASGVEDALKAYNQRQQEYASAKQALLDVTRQRRDAEAALQVAQEQLTAKSETREKRLKALKAGQAAEENGVEISPKVRQDYQQAQAELDAAEKAVQQRQERVLTADASQRNGGEAVKSAAEAVNGAAAQVVEARFAALRVQLEQPRSVEVKKEVGCGGKEAMDDCKARALQEAQVQATQEGTAVLVDGVRVATLQGTGGENARMRLTEKEIRTQVSGILKEQEVLDEGYTRKGGYSVHLRALVIGRAPEELRAGLTPPLADGSVPPPPPPPPPPSGKVFRDNLKGGGQGPEMASIPGGKFTMSSNDGVGDERPPREVQIGPFAIGVYEVTNAEYRKYKPDHKSSEGNGHNQNGDTQPVVGVSWDDAQGYAKWLSQQTGKSYRLPTEAEWEYAARGGTGTKYWWGDQAPVCQKGANNGAKFDDGKECNATGTEPVGFSARNPFGLHDVHGNVWEWVNDWYGDYPAASGTPPTDPQGPAGGTTRVIRGGGWLESARHCRSAFRNRIGPAARFGDQGFRLARTFP